MPYIRPAAQQLITNIVSDMSAALGYQVAPGTREYVIAVATALLVDDQYGYQDWTYAQQSLATCSGERVDYWANLKGVYRLPATAANGSIAFTGTTGALAPSGTQVNLANNLTYATTADFTVGTSTSVPVVCSTTGAAGNSPQNVAVGLVTSLTGITGAALTTQLTGGSNLQDDESLRQDALIAYRNVAAGGSLANFEEWALQTPGVTRVWVSPGYGSITVYPMFDVSEAAYFGYPQGTNGISSFEMRDVAPTATGDQLACANAIWTNEPVPSYVYVQAPQPSLITVTITGLGFTNTWNASTGWAATATTVQTQILASLQEVLVLQGTALGGSVQINELYEAVQAVGVASGFTIAAPTSPIITTLGYLPFLAELQLQP